jgi:glycerol uptake facilitator-like aquaporin
MAPPRARTHEVSETLSRRLAAEALGTALLLATVVGSGIMGAKLAGGVVALALLANALATGAMLVVLIHVFGPLSGAQFNPVVSLALVLRGALPARDLPSYIAAQVMGGLGGVALAHAMFDLPLMQVSTTLRWGVGQWVAEAVATFGLLLTIFGCLARAPAAVPVCVGLYITGAYWFTASTSFANPAVTLARALTDTFAGIAPVSVLPFLLAQAAGLALALVVIGFLWPGAKPQDQDSGR